MSATDAQLTRKSRVLPVRSSQERWEAVAIKDYYQSRHKLAYSVLSWAATHPDQSSIELIAPLREAASIIEWCIQRHPPTLPSYYARNLGIVYQRLAYVTHQPADHWRAVDAYAMYLEVGDKEEGGYDTLVRFVKEGPHPPHRVDVPPLQRMQRKPQEARNVHATAIHQVRATEQSSEPQRKTH